MEQKKWYLSKTLWGLAISGLGMIGAKFGVDIAPDDKTVTEVITIVSGIVEVLGLVVALYGRIKVTKTITAPPTA